MTHIGPYRYTKYEDNGKKTTPTRKEYVSLDIHTEPGSMIDGTCPFLDINIIYFSPYSIVIGENLKIHFNQTSNQRVKTK